ncbi:hypothetical protein CsSME_00035951 [Camellia sinensis var. sinensis]
MRAVVYLLGGAASGENDSGSKHFGSGSLLLGWEFARLSSPQRIRRWSTQLAFTVRGNNSINILSRYIVRPFLSSNHAMPHQQFSDTGPARLLFSPV